ncbi:Lrp/AsnC family transcriptional regulator [Marinilabiliaceae bacterium JC017]|nr:Lrp/AsnC family transcriptional regulator [Marinilabiliaceae bacterium JC017]
MIKSEKTSSYQPDKTDKKILELLQNDAKMTSKQIAHHLGLTQTPVFDRIKRLEKNGIIAKYVAILNKEKIGKNLIAFCNVSLKEHSKAIIRQFEEEIIQLPEVLECHHIAGMYDYMLKIITDDMEAYHQFIYNKLSSIDNIGNVQSSFVMNEIKCSTSFKLCY